jgi:hypothetical protein
VGLLNFDVKELYFNEPTDDTIHDLIFQAAQGFKGRKRKSFSIFSHRPRQFLFGSTTV